MRHGNETDKEFLCLQPCPRDTNMYGNSVPAPKGSCFYTAENLQCLTLPSPYLLLGRRAAAQ